MMKDADLSYTTHFFQQSIDPSQYSSFVLGADVGGTITNIAIAGIKNENIELLFSLDFETFTLSSFLPALRQTLQFVQQEYDVEVSSGCVGAAGVVSNDYSYVDLTNISWNIDAKDLIKKSDLSSLFILNDFQVLGYSLNTVKLSDDSSVIPIRHLDSVYSQKAKILIGPGTGLGKTICRYDPNHHLFHAYESEGGHADIPVYSDTELDLIHWIQHKKHPQYPTTYEDLLSGNGIVDIYSFLRSKQLFDETEYTKIIDQAPDKPMLISKYRLNDDYCKETFRLFRKFFARCAKNLALDTLPFGGIFIAGGIAMKNKDIFLSNEFKTEFKQSFTRSSLLEKIPLYLLSNYYLSLQGACFAAVHASLILKNQKEKYAGGKYESN